MIQTNDNPLMDRPKRSVDKGDRIGGSYKLALALVGSALLVSPVQGFSTPSGLRQRQRGRRLTKWHATGTSEYYSRQVALKKREKDGERYSSAATASSKRAKKLPQEFSPWMQQLFDHDLLTKEEEQRLGIDIQRAKTLRVALDAAVARKKEEQLLHDLRLEQARLEQLDDELEDEDEDELTRFSIYGESSSEWFVDEMLADTDGWSPEHTRALSVQQISLDELDLFTDAEIISQLNLTGGRSELQQILRDGFDARQTMLAGNFRLVVSIARSFATRNKGVGTWGRPTFEEVIQEGILGLATAVDRYQPGMDFRFATYATWWISNSVRNCFQHHAANIRLPATYYSTKSKYMQAVKRHLDMDGELPEIYVLANEVGVSVDQLERILRMTRPLVSIDERVGFSRDNNARNDELSWDLLDDFIDKEIMLPEDCVDLSFLRQNLENAMASELAPHERDVIRLRLGLDDGVRRTTRQVAQMFAPMLSVADVRQVEQTALRKLRSKHSLSTYKLVGVDENAIRIRR
ncbi:hypothetical protein MPSEU_000995700 [Mayamaea pseudoterrestris]|nr:hypothetical protein MPSEU_000995700 [Mayamaea pseudoterrestris]